MQKDACIYDGGLVLWIVFFILHRRKRRHVAAFRSGNAIGSSWRALTRVQRLAILV